MRKFLVKNYVLDYNFFGLNAPRASRITFPLIIIAGAFWIKPFWFSYVPLTLLAISLIIEFVYFRFYPAKYNELDNEQKKQYDYRSQN